VIAAHPSVNVMAMAIPLATKGRGTKGDAAENDYLLRCIIRHATYATYFRCSVQ